MFTIFFPSAVESRAAALLDKSYRYLISGVGVFRTIEHAVKEHSKNLIVLVGTAGGRSPLVRGDIILSSASSFYPDIPLRLGGGEILHKNNRSLVKAIRLSGGKVHDVCTVMVPGSSPKKYLVEAMEGYGVASIRRPFIELRVISNMIGESVAIDMFILERMALLIDIALKTLQLTI